MRGALLVLASAAAAYAQSPNCTVSDALKVDCGYVGINQQGCQAKGCCWSPAGSGSSVPWCFYPAGSPSSSSCFGVQPSMSLPFQPSEVATMYQYFLNNINIEGKGGIVAAPDLNTPGGSYYFHWERDAGLTMISLQSTLGVVGSNWATIEPLVKAYVQFVITTQTEADPNGIDIRTEPKYNLPNGDVFTGGWCRPQNDGPGLRAMSLILAANSLIANGETDFVKQYLWTGNQADYNGGAIKYDLDYIEQGYSTTTCDLWEEIRSDDLFWNRVTQKKALIAGAAFAQAMGDSASAASYLSTMQAINSTLYSSHWTGAYVQEATIRTRDSSVIVGFNTGYEPSDGMWNPVSYEVAATVASYNTLFCTQFAINTADTAAGVPGVMYGRYGGDSYAGGNPWVLSTAALANLLYRAAAEIAGGNVPDSDSLSMWASAFNVTASSLPAQPAALAQFFAAQGDGVLLRLRQHVQPNGFVLYEQIDRNTGVQLSATNLTWSYAEVLNAMASRATYLGVAHLDEDGKPLPKAKGKAAVRGSHKKL